MKTKDMNSGCKLIGLRQVNQISTLQTETFAGINFRDSLADLIFANFFLCESRGVAKCCGKSNMYPSISNIDKFKKNPGYEQWIQPYRIPTNKSNLYSYLR